MSKIALFGGTTEGRLLAEALEESGVLFVVCVATEYGEALLQKELADGRDGRKGSKRKIPVHCGRMNVEEMQEFLQKEEISLVWDATHPYAQQVTENLKKACKELGISYERILRESSSKEKEESKESLREGNMQEILQKKMQLPDTVYVGSVKEAVQYLEGTKGPVLIATGSKELAAYTRLPGYDKRCFVRVLSTKEAVEESVALGFCGAHLIAMQGPFPKELNVALLNMTQAKWFVTKESGTAGGFLEKAEAARECGAVLVVVTRPGQEKGISWQEAASRLDGYGRQEKEAAPGERCPQREVTLIGTGPGGRGEMTQAAWRTLAEAELVFGAGRMLQEVPDASQKELEEAYLPGDILSRLKKREAMGRPWKRTVVLLSGDVSFFSGAAKLCGALSKEGYAVRMLPGISSVAYFAARIQKDLSHAALCSLHGRSCNVAGKLRRQGRTFVLVDKKETIKELCKQIDEYFPGEVEVWIGSRLSYPQESIQKGSAAAFARAVTGADDLSVVYLEWNGWQKERCTCGGRDEWFVRGKVPMTKAEVRTVSISALELTDDAVVYDVGAGTGSVSVEMARLLDEGTVYAIERNPEGIALIRENARRFHVPNVEIVEGMAPEALLTLPPPTHAFIGGSGGNLAEIVNRIWQKNSKARIVVNAVTPETLAACLQIAGQSAPAGTVEIELTQLMAARSREAGRSHLMLGQNPVWIIVLYRKEEKERDN